MSCNQKELSTWVRIMYIFRRCVVRSANRTCFLFKFIVPCIELKIRIIALVLKSNGKKICVCRNLVEKKTVNSCLLSNPPTQIEAKEDKRLGVWHCGEWRNRKIDVYFPRLGCTSTTRQFCPKRGSKVFESEMPEDFECLVCLFSSF